MTQELIERRSDVKASWHNIRSEVFRHVTMKWNIVASLFSCPFIKDREVSHFIAMEIFLIWLLFHLNILIQALKHYSNAEVQEKKHLRENEALVKAE